MENLTEQWRKVGFLADRFEVSNLGRVRTLPYTREYTRPSNGGKIYRRRYKYRVLEPTLGRPSADGTEYPIVRIYVGHGRSSSSGIAWRIEKLVAAAFHGMPYDPSDLSERVKWQVRHLDGDIMNCQASNLEWKRRSWEKGVDNNYVRNRNAFAALDVAAVFRRLEGEVA